MIPPPKFLNPADTDFEAKLHQVPNVPGVYLLTPESGIPYLGWTNYLCKRLRRLLNASVHKSNPLANLRSKLARVDYWLTGSRLETSLLLYQLARRHDPERYLERLKLKMPWLAVLLLADQFPRLAVRNSVPVRRSLAFGPFPSRDAAERYQQSTEGLFQIRRCTDRLQPHEDHPGCIYGEMSLCMRPCQLAVSTEEYAAEVKRVEDYLQTNGMQMLSVLTAARDRASEHTDFEQAARLHKELEKLKLANSTRDNIVTEIQSLNGVAVTHGSEPRSIAVWPMTAGYWQACVLLDFSSPDPESRSLDRQIKERLFSHLSGARSEGDRLEHIALLSRWYYSTWRDGNWYPFRNAEDLDYRKLVRGISTLLREEELRNTAPVA